MKNENIKSGLFAVIVSAVIPGAITGIVYLIHPMSSLQLFNVFILGIMISVTAAAIAAVVWSNKH